MDDPRPLMMLMAAALHAIDPDPDHEVSLDLERYVKSDDPRVMTLEVVDGVPIVSLVPRSTAEARVATMRGEQGAMTFETADLVAILTPRDPVVH